MDILYGAMALMAATTMLCVMMTCIYFLASAMCGMYGWTGFFIAASIILTLAIISRL